MSLPLATSKCEPHRAFIDAQLRLGRNATAIYQDLVDLHGFDGAYNSVKRFCAQLRHKEPEQFDRLSFAPGEEIHQESERTRLTCEALADVAAGRVVNHEAVLAWAESLGTDSPLPIPRPRE